ncbi:MAG: hypothetical protein BAJATHORv1_10525 [Candidatus Thorarchaeota archaeon]|nr:MAG: hypothetical protein BAJATHORv1_10525 [Candidatus Thorarchaeota archaeon]
MGQTQYKKLVLVGTGGVGKSCISARLVTGEFIDQSMTVGMNVDSWTIVEEDDNAVIRTSIFDMGGQDRFRSFQNGLVSGADALLVVFSVNSFESFLQIDDWLELVREIPRERWVLVGNKIDEESSVPDAEIERRASELGVKSIKISAKTGENFDQLEAMLEGILNISLD